jgi:molybdenum cofactor synthesis domain-containing protein
MLEVAVITVSDRAFKGEYEDLSGPEIKNILQKSKLNINVVLTVVPDEKEAIRQAIIGNLEKDYIFTNGGTGISPRDITPEVTEEICDKELPGISEYLRRESIKETKNAVLSRGYSGVKGKTIIVNFPGSVKAVSMCTRLLIPVLEHGIKMIKGEKH